MQNLEKRSDWATLLSRLHISCLTLLPICVYSFRVDLFMSKPTPDEQPDSAAVLESMTLLATLSTAATVRESVAERRAGYDPSAQEPAGRAAARLRTAGRTLMDVLMQLALSRVPLAQGDEDQLSHAVRHFDVFLKLRRAERLTQAMHQHLLSLYPDVSEELVEEARTTHDAIDRFLDTAPADTEGPDLSDVLERGVSFVVWTRHEGSIGGGEASSNEQA